MSCCGEKRSKIYHDPYTLSGMDSRANESRPVQLAEGSYFVYTGATSLTANGVITRTVYRFDKPGAILEVDRRDAAFMTGIPNLRKSQGEE
jgi:hypothetical protein